MQAKSRHSFLFSAPVFLGLVPRIFWQQTPNQVNKIDIATAMALWILADHSQLGGGKNDINKILTKAKKAACF